MEWNIPEIFLQITRWHHNPQNCPEQYVTFCYILHLADIIAMLAGSGTGTDTLEHRLDSNYEKYIELPKNEFEKLYIKIDTEFEKINSMFKVYSSTT